MSVFVSVGVLPSGQGGTDEEVPAAPAPAAAGENSCSMEYVRDRDRSGSTLPNGSTLLDGNNDDGNTVPAPAADVIE